MTELAEDKFAIYESASNLLDTINRVFVEAGEILPSRQYLSGGRNTDAPHDCEQVVVSVEQMYNGTPGMQTQEPTGCETTRTVVFTVEIVRKQPIAQMARTQGRGVPTPDQYNEAFKSQASDMFLLMESALVFGESTWFKKALSDVSIGPESGEMQGVVLSLVASLW